LQFFLLATQLEQIWNDYQFVLEQIDLIKDSSEKKKKLLPMAWEKVLKLKEEYSVLDQLRTIESSIIKLREELAWAQVSGKEEV
jgi:hypothetical protein